MVETREQKKARRMLRELKMLQAMNARAMNMVKRSNQRIGAIRRQMEKKVVKR